MEFLVIDFRHPLFSIAMILLIVAVVAVANHWAQLLKAQKEDRKLARFLERFNTKKEAKSYREILQVEPNSVDSLMLLASIYLKSGDYNEAIAIYVALMEIAEDKSTKIEIMTLLAQTYFKAGFYKRSRDVLLDTIKLRARNAEALKLLLVIYEHMREHKKALDVIESLEELGVDESKSRAMIEASLIVRDESLDIEDKTAKLMTLKKSAPFLEREVLEFLFQHNPKLAWKEAVKTDPFKNLDLFWRISDPDLEAVRYSTQLSEIYSAKKLGDFTRSSEIFELDILIKLPEANLADLEFEYICSECLTSHPLYFSRCSACFASKSAKVSWSITKGFSPSDENSANFY